MGLFDDNPPGGFTDRPGSANGERTAVTNNMPDPRAPGQPVPGQPGFVFNSAGGIEPATNYGKPMPDVPPTAVTPPKEAFTNTPRQLSNQEAQQELDELNAFLKRVPGGGFNGGEISKRVAALEAQLAGGPPAGSGGGATKTGSGGTGSTGASGESQQATFRRIMKGLPSTPQNLVSKEKELNAAGIKVLRNAEGTAGKIQFDNGGQIVDVIQNAGLGGQADQEAWTWQTGEGGAGGAGGYGPWNQPFGEEFKFDDYNAPNPFVAPTRKELPTLGALPDAPKYTKRADFKEPTWDEIEADPNYQWTQKRGIGALDASAVARGTALGPGARKNLIEFGQGNATQFGENLFNRRLTEYGTNVAGDQQDFGNQMATYGADTNNTLNVFDRNYAGVDRANETGFNDAFTTDQANNQTGLAAWQANLQKALSAFGIKYDIYTGAQDRAFDQNLRTTALAMPSVNQKATASADNASQRSRNTTAAGQSAGNGTTSAANANAAGRTGRANAWNAGLSGFANAAGDAAAVYAGRNPMRRGSRSAYSANGGGANAGMFDGTEAPW